MRRKSTIRHLDWISLFLFLGLLIIGWLMQYAVSCSSNDTCRVFTNETSAGKHLIWIGVSLVFFIIVLVLDKNIWRSFSFIIYFLAIISLVLVLGFGNEVKGARSWFSIGRSNIFSACRICKNGHLPGPCWLYQQQY